MLYKYYYCSMTGSTMVLLLAVLCLLATPVMGSTLYTDTILESEPLVYFQFNEAAGVLAGDSVENDGTATLLDPIFGYSDAYPNSVPDTGITGFNDTTLINGLPLLGLESNNLAADFKGHGGLADDGDMLHLLSPSELDLEATTWSFFVNTVDENSWRRVMTTSSSFDNPFQIVYSNGELILVTQGGEEIPHAVGTTELGLNDGQWHHLVAVRNGANAENCKLYIDGQNIPLTSVSDGFGWSSSFRIGVRGTNTSCFAGMMDEITIWDHAMAPAEVAGLLNAATAVPEPSTIALLIAGLVGLVAVRRQK